METKNTHDRLLSATLYCLKPLILCILAITGVVLFLAISSVIYSSTSVLSGKTVEALVNEFKVLTMFDVLTIFWQRVSNYLYFFVLIFSSPLFFSRNLTLRNGKRLLAQIASFISLIIIVPIFIFSITSGYVAQIGFHFTTIISLILYVFVLYIILLPHHFNDLAQAINDLSLYMQFRSYMKEDDLFRQSHLTNLSAQIVVSISLSKTLHSSSLMFSSISLIPSSDNYYVNRLLAKTETCVFSLDELFSILAASMATQEWCKLSSSIHSNADIDFNNINKVCIRLIVSGGDLNLMRESGELSVAKILLDAQSVANEILVKNEDKVMELASLLRAKTILFKSDIGFGSDVYNQVEKFNI